MDRKLINTQITLQVGFEVSGVPTDPTPDSALVTVTRADGTVLANAATADNGPNGTFTYTISAAANDRLDTLTARWTTNLGTLTTVTEVVGGFYFSISDMQALLQDKNAQRTYDAATIAEFRTLAEQIIEDACGVAFVPRYERITVAGTGTTDLAIPRRPVRRVRDLTIDGATTSTTDIVASHGGAYWHSGWPAGAQNTTVGVEYGYDRPPGPLADACLLLAKTRMIKGPVDDRATQITDGEGGVINLLTPGVRGAVTGIPVVDAAINQYRASSGVYSVSLTPASNLYGYGSLNRA